MKKFKNNFIKTVLFAETLFSNFGLFSVLALLPLYFLNYLQFSPEKSAFLLFFSALSLKIARFIFFPLMNQFSPKQAFIISSILCSLGYLLMGLTVSYWIICCCLLLIGIGYGTSSILIKVMTTAFSDSPSSPQDFLNFSKLGIFINLGAALGPLLGNFIFIYYHQNTICFLASSIFLLAMFIAFLFPKNFIMQETHFSCIQAFKTQWTHKKVRILSLLTIFSGFLYAQFFTSLSVFVGKGLMLPNKIGLLFFINATIIIVASIPLSQFITKLFKNYHYIVCLSFGLFLIGFIILSLYQTLLCTYAVMVIWTIAEIWMLSSLNALVACSSQYKTMGFIINALSLGIGESLGNFIGMNLSVFGLHNAWHVTFICMSIIAFFLMILSYLFVKNLK